jgi:hypothetical protein
MFATITPEKSGKFFFVYLVWALGILFHVFGEVEPWPIVGAEG